MNRREIDFVERDAPTCDELHMRYRLQRRH